MKSTVPPTTPRVAQRFVASSATELGGNRKLDSPPNGHGPAAGRLSPTNGHASRDALTVVSARAGDHPSIHQLLTAVFHGPSISEFQATQDDPFYEPSDRVLVKNGERILSHVHLTKRVMNFGSLQVPIAGLNGLTTLPEFRGQGLATMLLDAAEQKCLADGAVLGVLRTPQPRFFERRGWIVCKQHYSIGSPRDILSQLQTVEPQRFTFPHENESPLNIRLWRHVEREALMRLYAQNTTAGYGPLHRSEAYWRWLISRRGYDRIYVAIDGPDKLELNEETSPIVGYAVMNRDRIVELMPAPGCPRAGVQLIARACADAIERDYHRIWMDAPPNSEFHELFESAGGCRHRHGVDRGEYTMVKLLDPVGFLHRQRAEFNGRVKASGIARPCELGLLLGRKKFQCVFSSRSAKIVEGKLGRSYLAADGTAMVRLLLGKLDVREAVEAGEIEASTRVAVETGQAVFSKLPTWHTPWDDLPGA